jgi:hypothetical protein
MTMNMKRYGRLDIDGDEALDILGLCKIININFRNTSSITAQASFPEPYVIGRNKFWKRSDVERYMQQQSGKGRGE